MSARVLVVGGAGYIGAHVVHDLTEAGHRVVVLDNLASGSTDNIPKAAAFIEGDLRHDDALAKALAGGVDVVFHFAALKAAGESMQRPHMYADNNIGGTLRLLGAMHDAGVTRFVFSSSAAVYGSPRSLPVDEDHPCDPENYYGYTKLAIEQNLAWFARLAGLDYISLRYFNATGYDVAGRVTTPERDPANLTPVVMEVAAGLRRRLEVYGGDYDTRDGTCIRDYIHVNDLAAAHLAAMDRLLNGGPSMVLNLGVGRGATVLEMIAAAGRALGREIPYEVVARRPGDPPALVASSERAARELGFKPRYSDLDTIFGSMRRVYGL